MRLRNGGGYHLRCWRYFTSRAFDRRIGLKNPDLPSLSEDG